MLALVQRVSHAKVVVQGQTVGSIGAGLLVLVCAEVGDTTVQADKLLAKLLKLRIFSDAQGKMNLSVQDQQAASSPNSPPLGLLLVSQFTLAADTSGGNRPSFKNAAAPELGRSLYDYFVAQAKALHPQVQTGIFAADMQVELVNDGPITIPLRVAPATVSETASTTEATPPSTPTPAPVLTPVSGAQRGHVTLVGAGPGDPELLTLKALRAIQSADIVFVDNLVSDAVLAHAAPHAQIVHVGKRGGCPSTRQEVIEAQMIRAAQTGLAVVRLKGGDPFVFGRGGEEVQALRDAGITVRIVNGITAGLAAATALGVPLTHREHAQGVVFVTGHAKPGSEGVDWDALAQAARQCQLTLVIYMGVRSAPDIQAALLHHLDPQTPVAIVEQATLPTQRHAISTLVRLQDTITHHHLQSPSVLIVGDVLKGVAALG